MHFNWLLMYSLLILRGMNSRDCIMVEEIVSAREAGAASANTATNSATAAQQSKAYFAQPVSVSTSRHSRDLPVCAAPPALQQAFQSFCLFNMWLWLMNYARTVSKMAKKKIFSCEIKRWVLLCLSPIFWLLCIAKTHSLSHPRKHKTHEHILNGVHGSVKQQSVTGRGNSERSV